MNAPSSPPTQPIAATRSFSVFGSVPCIWNTGDRQSNYTPKGWGTNLHGFDPHPHSKHVRHSANFGARSSSGWRLMILARVRASNSYLFILFPRWKSRRQKKKSSSEYTFDSRRRYSVNKTNAGAVNQKDAHRKREQNFPHPYDLYRLSRTIRQIQRSSPQWLIYRILTDTWRLSKCPM